MGMGCLWGNNRKWMFNPIKIRMYLWDGLYLEPAAPPFMNWKSSGALSLPSAPIFPLSLPELFQTCSIVMIEHLIWWSCGNVHWILQYSISSNTFNCAYPAVNDASLQDPTSARIWTFCLWYWNVLDSLSCSPYYYLRKVHKCTEVIGQT